MANFLPAFNATNRNEGGYANDPADKGGQTYMGISQKNWPNWGGWPIVEAEVTRSDGNVNLINLNLRNNTLAQQLVIDFYKTNFWDRARLSEFNDQNIASEIYDTGVHNGPGKAIKFLQRAINLTRKDVQVTADGQIGPKTIAAVNSTKGMAALYKTLNVIQGAAYIAIVESDPTQEKYFIGWLNRVNFLQ